MMENRPSAWSSSDVGPLTRDAASAAGSATIRRETEEADRITRERDLWRVETVRAVHPFCVAGLNSDGASKSCVNWGSRGDGAECASPLGFCVLCRTPSRGLLSEYVSL